jgi:diguanylate cyclase (GGDEF)-like protein/PAS domain S-box-containing protein
VGRVELLRRYLIGAGVLYVLSVAAALAGATSVQAAVLLVLGWVALASVPIGLRRWRPPDPRPWWCFGSAGALLLVAAMVRGLQGAIEGVDYPFPSWGEPLVLVGYTLLLVGLDLLVRTRRRGSDLEQVIDGLLVSSASGFLLWELAVRPALAALEGDPLAQVLSVVTFGFTLALVFEMVRLATGSGARTPSFWFFVAAVGAIFATEVLVTYETATGDASLAFGLVAPLAYLLAGAAALHPSMTRIAEQRPRGEVSSIVGHVALLAGALAVAPLVVVADAFARRPPGPLTAVLSAAISVLVLIRLTTMIHARDRRNQRERVLREAGARLAAASSAEQLDDIAASAAERLAADPSVRAGVQEVDPVASDSLAKLADMVAAAHVGLELTERRERERSERRFRSMIEQSSDLVLVLDAAGRAEFLTPSVERVLGYGPDADSAPVPLDVVHPDDRRRSIELVRDTMAFGTPPHPTLLRLAASDGAFHWFDVSGRDLRHDPTVGGVVLYARHVCDRVAAERDLAHSESRFRAIVAHSSDLVAVLDSRGVVQYVSPAVLALLGYEPRELVGTPFFELLTTDALELAEDLRTRFRQPFDRLRVEASVVARDGSRHALEVTFSDLRHEGAIDGIVVNATDVSDRKALEQVLRHQATHDELTGLGNRVKFSLEVAERAVADDAGVAVLVVDLDDFKTVNDSLGHVAGDALLLVVAQRLQTFLRAEDVATRLGGDEFVLLIDSPHGVEQVSRIAGRLLEVIRQPMLVEGRTINVTASIGVALARGAPLSADELLRNADMAMYLAKERGKDRFELFEERLHESVSTRLQLKADLARALDRGEFVVHFQPVVALTTGRIEGAEVLLRWEHPVQGLTEPGSFVPLAEETGLIVPLGREVWDQACGQLAAWIERFEGLEDFRLSVNASVREMEEDGFAAAVLDTCRRHGVEPDRMVLEVTESTLMRDAALMRDRLAALHVAGMNVAIDDFGTGYSSLASLRQYTFNRLKIDRSFVAAMGTAKADEMLRTIVHLARSLGVRSVAEGVERVEQLERLRALGCEDAQGFYFAPALPAAAFELLLHDRVIRRVLTLGEAWRDSPLAPEGPSRQ